MAGFAEGPGTLSEEVSVKSVDVELVRVFFTRDVVEVVSLASNYLSSLLLLLL